MSVDKVGKFFPKTEYKVIEREHAQSRHQYLFKEMNYKNIPYRHDKDEYFPTILRTPNGIYWETCPPKVIYGHNAYEISDADKNSFIQKSIKQLAYAGIEVNPTLFEHSDIHRLDVNKLVLIPFTIDFCMRVFEQAKQTGRMEKGFSLYPNQGTSCFNSLKRRKLMIYDKTKELETQNHVPVELKMLFSEKIYSVISVEYQMKKSSEIKAEFKSQNLKIYPKLCNVFDPNIAKTILLSRIQAVFDNIKTIDSPIHQLLETVEQVCKRNNIHGVQAIAAQYAFAHLVKMLGLNGLYNILCRWTDKKSAYRHYKSFKQLDYPASKDEIQFKHRILQAIEDMVPVGLETYTNFK